MFRGDDRPYSSECASCVILRQSLSARYSGCWNKKNRPKILQKLSYLPRFSFSGDYLTLFVVFILSTLLYSPLVASSTTQLPSSSIPLHHITNVASQKAPSSPFFSLSNLQQSPMSTKFGQNITAGYLNALIEEFGTEGSIGKEQFSHMMETIFHYFKHGDHHLRANSDLNCTKRTSSGISSKKNNNTNYSVEDEQSFDLSQLKLSCQCMNSSSIYEVYNLTDDYRLTRTDLFFLSPLILRLVDNCHEEDKKVVYFSKSSEAWAYGFLFVTIINICALIGVVVLPIMNTRIYKKVLLFLVALAVGSLAGSGLLVLIPEAFELVGTRKEKHAYLWMGTTIMSGVYLFFLIERLLKMVFEWKKRGKSASEADYDVIMDKNENQQLECATDELSDIVCSVKSKTPVDHDTAKMKDPANYHASASQCTSHLTLTKSTESIEVELQKKSINNDGLNAEVPNGCLHTRFEGGKKKKAIRTVAWMIIFGDGLHNFIDGLSIGAAFTANTMTGISVSVAVICEELPHELGDFAILLNAGMSMKQALCFNFLSACMCYIGLIFGILLAEVTAAHTWIFGVAGGMFLYISLVDMMPEMNQVVEAKENKTLGTTQLFILQNIGMILGFSIILVISLFAEQIHFGS